MILIFFRMADDEKVFYPIEIPDDLVIGKIIEEVAKENAELNPGTLKVEDTEGNILWQQIKH